MTDGGDQLELRTTATNDWTWMIVGTAIGLISSYALATSSAADWRNLRGLRRELIFQFIERVVGPTGIRIGLVGLALFFGLQALGAIWRLNDGGIALQADSGGLSFHPSLHHAELDWADVEAVELTSGHPATIKLRLKQRFWSLSYPFTGRNVQLTLIATGLTYRRAEFAVRQMRHWIGA